MKNTNNTMRQRDIEVKKDNEMNAKWSILHLVDGQGKKCGMTESPSLQWKSLKEKTNFFDERAIGKSNGTAYQGRAHQPAASIQCLRINLIERTARTHSLHISISYAYYAIGDDKNRRKKDISK